MPAGSGDGRIHRRDERHPHHPSDAADSDFLSAAIVGAGLGAERIEIWKDV